MKVALVWMLGETKPDAEDANTLIAAAVLMKRTIGTTEEGKSVLWRQTTSVMNNQLSLLLR